ncbi:MAG: STAS domain-containing protein [Candidatus Cloacimonetes bacterium]|nr:STAS domain-containing protein [Candidatus Cloacimonadota bacterium]
MKVVNNTLYLEGELSKHLVPALEHELDKLIKKEHINTIDLAGITMIDSAGVALFGELHSKLEARNSILMFRKANPSIQAVIDTFGTLSLKSYASPAEMGLFEKIGDLAVSSWEQFVIVLTLASEVFYFSALGLIDRKKQRKGSFVQQALLLGFDALPIVALLSFIIGFIMLCNRESCSGILAREFSLLI